MMKAVIFDVDRIVMNFSEQQVLSWREALRHFCHYVPLEVVRRRLNERGADALKSYFPSNVLDSYKQPFINHVALVFNDKYVPRIHVRPQMHDIIKCLLDKNISIGLVSTSDQNSVYRNKQLKYLEILLQTKTHFADQETDSTLTDTLAKSLASSHVNDPTEGLVICSTPSFAQAAHTLGMSAIGLACSGFAKAELLAAGCNDVCATMTELVQTVSGLQGVRTSKRMLSKRHLQERIPTLQSIDILSLNVQ